MTLPAPDLEFVFEIRARVLESIDVGRGPDEKLSFTPVVSGTVRGPRFSGRVLPGGGDWAVERGGTFQLEARYLIQHEDGTAVDVTNRGYYRASQEVWDRAEAGENVPETEYYFRSAPVFQTDAPAHRWLAENQFVGLARDEDGDVCVRIFLVT